MSDIEELRQMVLYFRVSELQVLLGFAGRNKSGKKHELQSRALELLKLQSGPIQMKIRELHKQSSKETMQDFYKKCVERSVMSKDKATYNGESPLPRGRENQRVGLYSAENSRGAPEEPPKLHQPMHAQLKNVSAYAVPRPNLPHQPPNLLPRSAMAYNSYGVPPKQMMPPLPAAPAAPYPINPDVRLKPLPFYDVIDELLRPASLLPTGSGRYQESSFSFNLTPTQATHVGLSRDNGPKGEYTVQIQLRFCLLETSCEQEDNFPPSICVKVNQKICNLPNPIPTNKPGVEPKRPSRPVNITPYCKLCPTHSNVITVSWASEFGRAYTMSVYLVKKLTSVQLLQRLRMRGQKNADHTRAMIKEKLTQDPDSEIATTSLRGSLMCPLGKMRMQVPSRSSTCTHLQCFDASLYIQMNEKKPTWICPVCDKPATFNNLIIDGLFLEITQQAPSECVEVQFHENGNWSPIYPKKEAQASPVVSTSPIKITATKRESKEQGGREKKKSKVEVIDLTTESGSSTEEEEEEEEQTTTPRPLPPAVSSPPTTSPTSSTSSCGVYLAPSSQAAYPQPPCSSDPASSVAVPPTSAGGGYYSAAPSPSFQDYLAPPFNYNPRLGSCYESNLNDFMYAQTAPSPPWSLCPTLTYSPSSTDQQISLPTVTGTPSPHDAPLAPLPISSPSTSSPPPPPPL